MMGCLLHCMSPQLAHYPEAFEGADEFRSLLCPTSSSSRATACPLTNSLEIVDTSDRPHSKLGNSPAVAPLLPLHEI
jgi:hypothetical protein